MVSGWIVLLGVWLMTSPMVLHSPIMASWNAWIVAVLAVFCGTRLQHEHKSWQATLAIIAGACTFIAGFISRLQFGPQFVGRSVIFGGLLFIAGASSFGPHHEVPHTMPRIYW